MTIGEINDRLDDIRKVNQKFKEVRRRQHVDPTEFAGVSMIFLLLSCKFFFFIWLGFKVLKEVAYLRSSRLEAIHDVCIIHHSAYMTRSLPPQPGDEYHRKEAQGLAGEGTIEVGGGGECMFPSLFM